MAFRPPSCNCHCCEDEPPHAPLDITHRDLLTGDPHPESNLLDARELLLRLDDGDVTGLTQETITQNCTAIGSVVTRSGNGADDVPGHFRMSVTDVVPSVKNFSALQVIWTGETFDAAAHVAHIASGGVTAYASASRQKPTTFDPADNRTNLFSSQIAPIPVWGIVIRSGSTVLVSLTPNPTATGGFFDPDAGHACWRQTAAGPAWRILENGNVSGTTISVDVARAHGLIVDPLAIPTVHEIGFCFGIITVGDSWSGTLESNYASTYSFDAVSIYRTFGLQCVAAFANLSTLTVSMPVEAATHVSNCEPREMGGISASLTLTPLPVWDIALHPLALESHHDSGYAYIGSTVLPMTLGDVTITWYYTPCSRLTVSFEQLSQYACPVWISIRHTSEFTDDDCNGRGDNGTGLATSPTIVGWYYRDFYQLCDYSAGDEILDTRWFGTDCIDNPHQTSPSRKNGIVGECHGSDDPLPLCLSGNLPNQLSWMTDCFSLDPIAIGYRRRLTNAYTGFGPACDEANLSPCDFEFGGDHYPALSACQFEFLQNMGFSFALESDGADRIAGFLYMDITE
jgi:hypothetical protein